MNGGMSDHKHYTYTCCNCGRVFYSMVFPSVAFTQHVAECLFEYPDTTVGLMYRNEYV